MHEPTNIVVFYWPGYYIYPAGTVFQPQVASGEHTHWCKEQVPVITPKLEYRVETKKIKTYVNVAKEVDVRRATLYYEPVQRLVEKEIVTTVILPTVLLDTSGCLMVICRVEIKPHKVRYPVTDYRLVQKEYAIKETHMVPEERSTEYRAVVPVVRYDQTLVDAWRPVHVPYQKMITVPTIDLHHMPPNFFP
jgi:hypothetical protein